LSAASRKRRRAARAVRGVAPRVYVLPGDVLEGAAPAGAAPAGPARPLPEPPAGVRWLGLSFGHIVPFSGDLP
jgi:hypothetical protein